MHIHTQEREVSLQDLDSMDVKSYDKRLARAISVATALKDSDPCADLPRGEGDVVIYIKQEHDSDWDNWMHLAKCWKIWDLDPRGYHKQYVAIPSPCLY